MATSARNLENLSVGAQHFLAGRNPIVFNVAHVFGRGAHGEHISLHRAIVVLLDPVQCNRIGEYEMQVFAAPEKETLQAFDISFAGATDMPDAPVIRFSISPSSCIAVPYPSVAEIAAHGVKGPSSYTLQFHTAAEADAFARDFQVRSRVMKLSLRTARQSHVGEGSSR